MMQTHAYFEERDRQLIAKALSITITAIDVAPGESAQGAERKSMANLLSRMADDGELELYGQYGMRIISKIAAKHKGRNGSS